MSNSVEKFLQKGLELHQIGQTEFASQIYKSILTVQPHQPEANYKMGLLAVGSGEMQAGLAFLETALETNADNALYWISYIDTLHQIGRIEDAQAIFNQAKNNGAKGEGFDQLEQRLKALDQEPLETSTAASLAHQDQPNILKSLKPDHTEAYNNLGAIQMSNPYKDMHVSKFWSTAVAERVVAGKGLELMDAGVLFESGKKVASVGSCFAKEIGKKLVENGMDFATYQTQESELDSFGLGNVYTTRHFLQWMEFSIGERNWSSNMHQFNNGVVEDLTMNSQYHYSDHYECINKRTSIALNLINVLRSVDVLVLTLGLTEMWQSPCNEAFAMCPGTSKGIFSHEHHFFKNLTFGEVTSDLRSIWQIIQKINPKLEIILTVSPVPLTATAARENVLVASAKSKSTLRAAAGEFIDSDEKLHYFPSYELITHVNNPDWRFNKNLRTVSSEGVSYVMSHLFEGETFNIKKSDNVFNQMLDEDLCEEARLGQFNQRKPNMSLANNKEIFVIGDSHMGKLCEAMVEEKISFQGGMIMNGSGFSDHKFKLNSKTIFTVEEKPEYALFWEKLLRSWLIQNLKLRS